VHALGTLKDQYSMERLRRHGVDRHEDAIALVQALRTQDVRAAVVSSRSFPTFAVRSSRSASSGRLKRRRGGTTSAGGCSCRSTAT
jgi:hypothetical protein